MRGLGIMLWRGGRLVRSKELCAPKLFVLISLASKRHLGQIGEAA
jgi:hypothetical protein